MARVDAILVFASVFFFLLCGGAPEVAHAGPPKPAKPATVVISASTKVVGEIAGATSLPAWMTAGQKAATSGVVAKLRAKNNDAAQQAFEQLINGLAANAQVPAAVQAGCKQAKQAAGACKRGYLEAALPGIVQWVLREAYLEPNADLAHRADKVRHFNQQKKAIHDQVSELRAAHGKFVKGKAQVKTLKLLPRFKGKPSIQLATEMVSEAQLDSLITKWEEQLASVGDDAQLANVDLQSALQKQQQTMQTMSSVSKMLHDTAMAIIRKIG
jgi:hypothetical protein